MRFPAGTLATLDGVTDPRRERTRHGEGRTLSDRLRDPMFRAELERLHAEMREGWAPAAEGPVVNPGRRRRGRLVFGDATE
jgi:hypothetical protein